MSDALDAVGMRDRALQTGLRPLLLGQRAVGRAATAQFEPTDADSDDPYRAAIEFVDSLGSGAVAVIATGSDGRTAYWGELFSAAAMGRGAAGTICDGPVRDVAKIRRLGYPVFAAGARPVDFRARMRLTGSGIPVRCHGVLVEPGDLIVADDDGAVAVPQAVERQVLAHALARLGTEATVLDELLDHASLSEVWRRWKVL